MAVLRADERALVLAARRPGPTWLLGRNAHGETTATTWGVVTVCADRETLDKLTRYLCTGETTGVRRTYDPERGEVCVRCDDLTLRLRPEEDDRWWLGEECESPLSSSPHLTLLALGALWRTCEDGSERSVSFEPCPWDRGRRALDVHRVTPARLVGERARDPLDPFCTYAEHMLFREDVGLSRGEQLARQLTALNPLPWAPVNLDTVPRPRRLRKSDKDVLNAGLRRGSRPTEDVRSPAFDPSAVFGPQYPWHV